MTKSPRISIILPTFNRLKFLPEAFAAIRSQAWSDWELIVVDDGSTDGTRDVIAELTRDWAQPVKYIYQENQGAYGARNTGLDHASGEYFAFYDSDDLWLPHHLQQCAQALVANLDVDWVYGACRIVDWGTRKEMEANTFHIGGAERPFLKLKSRSMGNLRIIEDRGAAACQVLYGLYCGLQNSVIRRRVFEDFRFEATQRNEAEDQVIVIWALTQGFRLGYLDAVHVNYAVHSENSSAVTGSDDKKARVLKAMADGFEKLLATPNLPKDVRTALRRRLGQEYFWKQGYSMLWTAGRHDEALEMFRRGIRTWPWDLWSWKTYALARVKVLAMIGRKLD